jgi:hypothetical protein
MEAAWIFAGKASWNEEVPLREGGQADCGSLAGQRAVIEEIWKFTVQGSGRELIWRTSSACEPDKSSLDLLILGFVDGPPFIAAWL